MTRHGTASVVRQLPHVIGKRRDRIKTATEQQITAWVESQAARFGVSKSFVVSVAIAIVADIDIDYGLPLTRAKRTRKGWKRHGR